MNGIFRNSFVSLVSQLTCKFVCENTIKIAITVEILVMYHGIILFQISKRLLWDISEINYHFKRFLCMVACYVTKKRLSVSKNILPQCGCWLLVSTRGLFSGCCYSNWPSFIGRKRLQFGGFFCFDFDFLKFLFCLYKGFWHRIN